MNFNVTTIIILCASFVAAVLGFIMRAFAINKQRMREKESGQAPTKKSKAKIIWLIVSIVGSWFFVVELLSAIFTEPAKGMSSFEVELFAPRMQGFSIFGYTPSTTVVISWIVIAVISIIALLIRIFVIPRFTEQPKGLQNVLEICVGEIEKYIDSKTEGMGVNFGAYIFTIATYMIGCAIVEMFGVRAPTSDLTVTFAMALITFFLINAYGIARKGVVGRIKTLANPTPVVLPIKIVTDMAVPVSLACRLFGNMLGGMIVMDLLYCALGGAAVGIPSILALYFNVFHPLIQAFIFVTLSLTFINEAIE